ncbi:anti-sigma F factor antagonist [Clostridia bacterium]|nr:anti-sigma F factor antagonist [Clostridia bacterium]
MERREQTMIRQSEQVNYEVDNHNMVVHLPKELDHHNCLTVKNNTEQIMDETYINRIIFDFTHTHFMDSSGIGVLLGRYKRMMGIGGEVAIYGVNERIKRLLHLSGISKLIRQYETKEQAVRG